MTDIELRAVENGYPRWEPTDWTPHQRRAAIRSLLLLACSCLLITGALLRWGTRSPAQTFLIPIGMTLLTLGMVWLATVFWYPYQHAHNRVGALAGTAEAGAKTLAFLAVVAVICLAMQALAVLLIVAVGWTGWDAYGPYSYLLPAALGVLLTLLLTLGQSARQTTPTRDPTAPGSRLGASATGARLGVRWIVMLAAQLPWVVLGGALSVLNVLGSGWSVHAQSILFGALGAFFLLATLAELTHHG